MRRTPALVLCTLPVGLVTALVVQAATAQGASPVAARHAHGEESIFKSIRVDRIPASAFTTFGGPDASGEFGDKLKARTTDPALHPAGPGGAMVPRQQHT